MCQSPLQFTLMCPAPQPFHFTKKIPLFLCLLKSHHEDEVSKWLRHWCTHLLFRVYELREVRVHFGDKLIKFAVCLPVVHSLSCKVIVFVFIATWAGICLLIHFCFLWCFLYFIIACTFFCSTDPRKAAPWEHSDWRVCGVHQLLESVPAAIACHKIHPLWHGSCHQTVRFLLQNTPTLSWHMPPPSSMLLAIVCISFDSWDMSLSSIVLT